MQILIIAATAKEIEPFSSRYANMDILITGVGIAATTYHLQKRLQQIDYDLVIQAGIAGSFSDEIRPPQTVLIKQDCFGDLGLEEKGIFETVFEAGLCDQDEFPFENGWLINRNALLDSLALPVITAVTVNKVTDDPLQKNQLIQKYSPMAESMEGAALHYVCLQEKISFLQIRSISNYVGERDRTKWKMKEAIADLNIELEKIINRLTG